MKPIIKKTIYQPTAVAKNFQRFGQHYQRLTPPVTNCFSCDQPFQFGQMMTLLQMSKGPNKLVCDRCADEVLDGAAPFIDYALKRQTTMERS